MYFKISGNMDIEQMMLSSANGGIDSKKFCEQILNNNLKIEKYITNAQLELWKDYYDEMHPKSRLLEELLQQSSSKDDIRKEFKKFFKPLCADICKVSIIDPYLFAEKNDVDFLCEVLESNVLCKKISLYTNKKNDSEMIKNSILSKLKALGFVVEINNTQESHDRFWYTRVAGFTIGTSFNGLGNKLSAITQLSQKDLDGLIRIFGV